MMDLQLTTYLITLAIALIASIAMAIFALTRRGTPAADTLALFAFGMAIWLSGYTPGILSRELATALFWARIEYIGIVLVPPAWLLFALIYTGVRPRLEWRLAAMLGILPAITLALVWTNSAHGLIWRQVTLIPSGALMIFSASYGPWFWVHTAYSYGCIIGGGVLLLRALQRDVYRKQAGLLVAAALAPLIGNVLYLFGLSPWGRLDLTPLLFAFSLGLLTWAVLGFRLLDLVPVARSVVIEHMREGVMVLDARHRVIDINPAGLAQLGRSSGEVIGRTPQELMPHLPEVIERYVDIDEIHEELYTAVNGEERWSDLRIIPLRDSRGRLRARLVVWHDITDIKRTTQELVRAREAAEAANRAKSTFLANMSHELRTPLTAILGYTQLMSFAHERGEHERVGSDLESVTSAGNHLLTLIDGILNLAKIEANRETLNIETQSLELLVADVVQTSQPLVSTNGNTLDVCFNTEPGHIRTDILKLRQVLINLLGNATKFTRDGTITLTVTRERDAGDHTGEWVIFSVKDTGIGIAPDQLPQLFEAFRQADASTTRQYGGTGLGLTISQRYCEMLGGSLSAESEPGLGSTFTVRLPVDAG